MKGGKDDKSKCTVQAKAGRNGKVVFATLSPLGFLFPMVEAFTRVDQRVHTETMPGEFNFSLYRKEYNLSDGVIEHGIYLDCHPYY